MDIKYRKRKKWWPLLSSVGKEGIIENIFEQIVLIFELSVSNLYFDFIFNMNYSQIFLSWHSGAERQTCHVTLIVPHVMN